MRNILEMCIMHIKTCHVYFLLLATEAPEHCSVAAECSIKYVVTRLPGTKLASCSPPSTACSTAGLTSAAVIIIAKCTAASNAQGCCRDENLTTPPRIHLRSLKLLF